MRSVISAVPQLIVVSALVAVPAARVHAQHDHDAQCACCRMSGAAGQTAGGPMMRGSAMAGMQGDMADFHFLLDHRAEIRRTVTNLPDGVETLTESDVPEVAARLRVHVSAMYARLEAKRPIHQRDPLFREVFAHADQIRVIITPTANGLRVVETSAEPAVVKLVQAHAEVVDAFLKNGMSEMMKDHPVP